MTQEWIAEQKGWISYQYPPAYAPEVNWVEYLWGYWKQPELPNVCLRDYWELGDSARRTLKRIRRRPASSRRAGSNPAYYLGALYYANVK
jgi:hypothetical protein